MLQEIAAPDGFLPAVASSFFLIIVSEIGDKTFFIAALLAMKRGALVTFAGCGSALVLMTILSALAGKALPYLIDPTWTKLASIFLFLLFGIKLLYEALTMEAASLDEDGSELKQVELELKAREVSRHVKKKGNGSIGAEGLDLEDLDIKKVSSSSDQGSNPVKSFFLFFQRHLFTAALSEAFILTFAAEWGDRSQIATLALGASKNFFGVNLGAIVGHLLCTSIAILGGKALSSRISEKTVSFIGSFTFLFFAVVAYLFEL